jgi:hypothetical protein
VLKSETKARGGKAPPFFVQKISAFRLFATSRRRQRFSVDHHRWRTRREIYRSGRGSRFSSSPLQMPGFDGLMQTIRKLRSTQRFRLQLNFPSLDFATDLYKTKLR